MLAIASQIILCLVLAALLGLIIGYLLGKSNCPKPTYKTAAADDPHTKDDGDCQEEEAENASDTESDGDDTEANEEESLQTDADEQTQEETASPAQNLLNTEAEATANQAPAAVETDKAEEGSPAASAQTQKNDSPTAASAEDGTVQTDTDTKPEPAEVTESEAEPTEEDRPETLLSAPKADRPQDDLKRIKGIGVKIEALLNEIGVYYFEQIATWTEKEAAWIDHKVSFPGRALRDDWIGQAKLLAAGGETEFSKRVDRGEVASSKKG